MMKRVKIVGIIFFTLSFFALDSCKKNTETEKKQRLQILNETSTTVDIKYYDGTTRTLKKNPKKVIIITNPLLGVWYFSGGSAIGKIRGNINVPRRAHKLQIVGTSGHPNLEKIISLKPDLVILSTHKHGQQKLMPFLKKSNIDCLALSYNNYWDFLTIAELFCHINNSPRGLKRLEKIKSEVNKIIAKCPANKQLSLITFSSANGITAELPQGDTGTILQMLRGNNIAKISPLKRGTRVEMSVEKITEMNPEVMFVKQHGKSENRLREFFKSNSSLQSISAIKDDRLYFLPRELFLYKPNERYPEAFFYMAERLYPDAFL